MPDIFESHAYKRGFTEGYQDYQAGVERACPYLREFEIDTPSYSWGLGYDLGREAAWDKIGGPGQRGGSAPGGGVVGPTDVEWAKGVRAVRDMGGQVPQKAVKQADKILQKAGLTPTIRKAPKRYKDIVNFYENIRPIPGDIWETKGITIEVGEITRSGSGGSEITIHTRTTKGGRASTLYTKRDWTDPASPDWAP